MVTITVKVTKQTLPSLSFDNIEDAADGVRDYLLDYYRDFATKWRGPKWIPGPKSGQFAQNVIEGWQQPVISGNRAKIVNTFGLLAWKMTGGTITPKVAQYLTIPLTTAAKSYTAPTFPGGLFKRGMALSNRIGKQVTNQYALSKGVTQAPWPGAFPPIEELETAAGQAVSEAISEELVT